MPRIWLTGLTVIIMLAFLVWGTWQISRSRSFQFFGGIVQRVHTGQKVAALTFDDGPTREGTERILKVLDETGVKATFFVTGSELRQNPIQGRMIADAGHELGNHTYSHPRMVMKSYSFISREIETTDRLIRETGYRGPIQFRPPNGKKLILLPYYLKQHHRKTILWDIEPDSDPVVASSAVRIEKLVADSVKPGSIILLHVMYNSRLKNVAATPGIIRRLRKKGYQFLTVSQLLALRNSN